MKIIIALATMLFCLSVRADIPAYSPMRDWVEKNCATNTVPKDECVFIGHEFNDYASIVRYHNGITIREIIDQTKFNKDRFVTILVMRSDGFMKFITVKPSEKPEFDLKPLDLLWIYDEVPIF